MSMRYLYDGSRCLTAGCKNMTLHRSGICTEHRVRKCEICGVSFVYQNFKIKRCSDHRDVKDKATYQLRVQQNAQNIAGETLLDFISPVLFFLLGVFFQMAITRGWV